MMTCAPAPDLSACASDQSKCALTTRDLRHLPHVAVGLYCILAPHMQHSMFPCCNFKPGSLSKMAKISASMVWYVRTACVPLASRVWLDSLMAVHALAAWATSQGP